MFFKKIIDENSWVFKRYFVFKKISFDILISIFLVFFIDYFYKSIDLNLVYLFLIQFFWIFISYVIGRYSYNLKKIKAVFTYLSVRSLIAYLIILFLSLVVSIKIEFLSIEILFILFIGSIISNFSLFILSIKKILNNRKETKLFFIGDPEEFNKLRYFLKQIKYENEIFYFKSEWNFENSKDNNNGIIICDLDKFNKIQINQINILKKDGFIVQSINEWFEKNLNFIPSEIVQNYYLTERIKNKNMNIVYLRIKRFGDIIVSLLLLIFASPIILISAIIIKIQDNGDIFYSQIRSGYKKKKFRIFKLRTMIINAEVRGAKWSSREDSRITFFGNLLRILRIDELPQLWNVLLGDMSLIGPRPERPIFDDELEKNLPNYNLRYLIKPGITGWAQVNYTYTDSIETSKVKLGYDLYYIKSMSLNLDFLILMKTIKTIITLSGAKPH